MVGKPPRQLAGRLRRGSHAWLLPAFGVLGCSLLLDRPALAYIDPGTGGAVFGSLVPLIGLLSAFVASIWGMRRFFPSALRAFVRRHPVWLGAAAALSIMAVLLALG